MARTSSLRIMILPLFVIDMPQIYIYMRSLLELFDMKDPSLHLIQVHSFMEICYVFGYSSGSGFGLTWIDLGISL